MRTSTHLRCGLLVLVAACGGGGGSADGDAGADGSVGPPQPTCVSASGDRLRLKVIEAEGATVVEGLFDADLETSCVLGTIDGAVRCLPSPTPTGTIFFSDPECTNRLLLPTVPFGAERPAFFREDAAAGDGCGVVPSFSPILGDLPQTGAETIYTGGPGACTGVLSQAALYHTLGAPIASTELAEVSPAELGGGDRIELSAFEGADGSRICQTSLRDNDTGLACSLATAEDGETRCLPPFAGATAVFADNGCTIPSQIVIHDNSCGAVTPSFEARIDASFCRPRVRLRSTGTLLGQQVFQGAPGACTGVTLAADQVALEIGPGVVPFTFAGTTRADVALGGRLDRVDVVLDDGPRLEGTLHDNELAATCTFQSVTDVSVPDAPVTTLRCVPNGGDAPLAGAVATGTFFSDAVCSVPIEIAQTSEACGDEGPRYATRNDGNGPRVFPVTGPLEVPIFTNPAACAPVDTSVGGWFTIGAEIPIDGLVLGTRRTE